MYESIINLISLLTNNIFSRGNKNIFQGNQNNYARPANNNYIIVTELYTDSMGMPQTYYDQTLENRNYNNLDNTRFQVDFYGIQARNTAANFRMALQSSFATDFLFADGDYTIGEVQDLINQTMVLDQEIYVPRFIVKFSVLNNNYLNIPIPSYETQEIGLLYAGNTTGSIINN